MAKREQERTRTEWFVCSKDGLTFSTGKRSREEAERSAATAAWEFPGAAPFTVWERTIIERPAKEARDG